VPFEVIFEDGEGPLGFFGVLLEDLGDTFLLGVEEEIACGAP
jgi:hypothetical protein